MLCFLMSPSLTTSIRSPLLYSSAKNAPPAPLFCHQEHQNPLFPSFVFNGLRTILQLGGRGGMGTFADQPQLRFVSASNFVFPISSFVFPVLLTPLESSLPDKLRVSPRFVRNHPPANPLESALPRSRFVSSLESAHARNRGEGGHC
jgi:hypothetical protein